MEIPVKVNSDEPTVRAKEAKTFAEFAGPEPS
jgi:hypothetical protein